MELSDSMYSYRYEYDYAKVIGHCKNCGCNIHEGDEAYNFFGMYICDDCLLDFKIYS
ncbi:hypothetical protein [Clostridium thermobutyricum]|uniref:hypothetical protein n=1 Tax=Clostridium thermobutyricum TaxID=29372 RepID=UPI002942634E|nr:hypothetical protein [Clostridium thermobutyricum]